VTLHNRTLNMGKPAGLSLGTIDAMDSDEANISAQGTLVMTDKSINKLGIAGAASPVEFSEISLDDLHVDEGEIVGKGAFGVVKKVVHQQTKTVLAVKELNIQDKELRNQTKKELAVMVECKADGIVKFYNAFFDSHTNIYLCMEFMDGGSLDGVIKNAGAMPEKAVAHVAKSIMQGIFYLHKERHQLHRDLKPGNVLCNSAGDVKVADFGISRALGQTDDVISTYLGTAAYMSPERLEGEEYSFPSDIWAVGVIILECALGKFPFGNFESFFDLLEKITGGIPDAPDTLSADGKDFIKACTAMDPKERKNATDLLDHPFLKTADRDAFLKYLKKHLKAMSKSKKSKK